MPQHPPTPDSSEPDLAAAFDACLADAPIACHEIDLSGRVTRVNEAECELLGVGPEYIVGREIWEFVSPEQRERSREAVEHKLGGSRPLTCFEREYVRPDGRRLVLEIRDTCIRDPHGRIAGLRSFLLDVTARSLAEQAVRESERRLKHLVENARDIMYRADLRGRFTFVNPTAAKIFHCRSEDLIGRSYLDLIRPDWRDAAHRFYRDQVAHRTQNTYYEFPAVTMDGRELWFGQNVQLIFEGSRIVGVQAMARDITDRKQAEMQLQLAHAELERRVAGRTAELALANESLRREIEERRLAEEERRRVELKLHEAQRHESLGVLAGGLAHDFNNLLTTILGYTTLAMSEVPADSTLTGCLTEIEQAARRAADITIQMLAYSGRGRFLVERLSVPGLIDNMYVTLRNALPRHTELRLIIPNRVPDIDADPTQIRHMLWNLVTNASDALEDQPGVITIRTGSVLMEHGRLGRTLVGNLPEGEYVFVEVNDTGAGMDEAVQNRIFDPFYSTKFVGRGLGLPAVLGIVRAHGGTIEVEAAPGRGSTFRVLLPPAVSGASDPASANETSAQGSL